MSYCLAIDIGASSGRHILGSIVNGKLTLEEVYRFKNGAENIKGKLFWNSNGLFESIVEGLKKCKEIGKIPHPGGRTWPAWRRIPFPRRWNPFPSGGQS